jgi:hypothetical protein
MEHFNKYIKENGVILLIQSYIELSFVDIVHEINNIRICTATDYLYLKICIYILTNDHFVRIKVNKSTHHVSELKFKCEKKEYYTNILTKKYTTFYDHNTFDKEYSIKNLQIFLQNYNIELYNIKLIPSYQPIYKLKSLERTRFLCISTFDLINTIKAESTEYINMMKIFYCNVNKKHYIKDILRDAIICKKLKPHITIHQTFDYIKQKYNIVYIGIHNFPIAYSKIMKNNIKITSWCIQVA